MHESNKFHGAFCLASKYLSLIRPNRVISPPCSPPGPRPRPSLTRISASFSAKLVPEQRFTNSSLIRIRYAQLFISRSNNSITKKGRLHPMLE